MRGSWCFDGEGRQGGPGRCGHRDRPLGALGGRARRFLLVPVGPSQRGGGRVSPLAADWFRPSRTVAHRGCLRTALLCSPRRNAPLLAISPFPLSLRYIFIFFFVLGEMLLLSLPFNTSSIFIIINVIPIQ